VRLYDTAPPGTSAAARGSEDLDRPDRLERYGSGLGGGYGGAYSSGGGSAYGSRDGGGGSLASADSYRRSGSGGGGGGGGRGRAGAAHAAGGWRLRKDVTTRMTRWTITGGRKGGDGARFGAQRRRIFGPPSARLHCHRRDPCPVA
jgi:hypothetical protein